MCQTCSCVNEAKADWVTLIIKLVDFCNFECSFCRYSTNKQRHILSFDTYKNSIIKACEYNIANGCNFLTIIHHGGEPLLWEFDNFNKAIALQKELQHKYPGFIFINNIQTNGSLLNQQWIDFFKTNHFKIGLSIDGPTEINFHKDCNGDQRVLDNIRRLNESGCNFGILSVITDNHKGYADKYYDFLVEHNIHSVGLCYCVYDVDSGLTVKQSILTDFLIRLFDRYYHGHYKLQIREFESVMKLCLGGKASACAFSYRKKCGNFLTIQPNGDVIFCDPYTLGDNVLGNIMYDTLYDIKSSHRFIEHVVKAANSVVNICADCEVQSICGGGCYRSLFGIVPSAFCETFKAVYPHIRKTIFNDM